MTAFQHKVSVKKIAALILWCLGLISISSFISHAQTETLPAAHQDLRLERTAPTDLTQKESHMVSQHEDAKLRLKRLREKSQKRAAERAELRRLRKAEVMQARAARQVRSEQERERHMAFKTELLSMLAADAVLEPNTAPHDEAVEITYKDGDIFANGINLSEQFGTQYHELWQDYERAISDMSYIIITPKLYEIRETGGSGANYHFRLQTG